MKPIPDDQIPFEIGSPSPGFLHRTKLAAAGVTRVIHRCEEAKETEILDLSECELMKVPDAVFHLMRNTAVRICLLGHNCITKVSTKLPIKFSGIVELDLCHNKLGLLPSELSECKQLARLDISHNYFLTIPEVVLKISSLEFLNLEHNSIADVTDCDFESATSLKEVNLKNNPLNRESYKDIATLEIKVHVSPFMSDLDEDFESFDDL